MRWGDTILIISMLLGSVLLITTKLVYHLALGIFLPLLAVFYGLITLAIIWCRYQRAKSNVKVVSAPHVCNVYSYEPSTSRSHAPLQEIDENSLSALHNGHREADGIARMEMDAAAAADLAYFNRLTNQPQYNTTSNRTTISTTFGVYGEIEPPLPVIKPLKKTLFHGEKQNICIQPHKLTTFPMATPSRYRSSKSYRPLSSSPYASTRTSCIIEMYADFEQRSGTPAGLTAEPNEERIRTGMPF